MMIFADDKKMCAVCKYWSGNANIEFIFGHKIKVHDHNAMGYCRESQVKILALRVCPKFERRADL